jgi:catechol 2,3-dioxygenase-like lactoylglutathione lyase family enzyme
VTKEILGIHHITAIAGDPQANHEFYVGKLGLRLIKLTVNFDDPGTYHLYYGDGAGTPGTIITFFPWPQAPRGRHGTGQVTAAAFAVPADSMDYWADRLKRHGIAFRSSSPHFGEPVLSFFDPDGLNVELVASEGTVVDRAYQGGPIPLSYAIRGLHSATLMEEGYRNTAALLSETMGFRLIGQEGNRSRYAIGSGAPGTIVDVLCAPEERRGSVLAGTVHHIAWRTPDGAQQSDWLLELIRRGHNVSPIMDRKYFHSIYYREPGGILFEIATDTPGFAVDEPLEHLGTKLVLPDWLEARRGELEATLPPLDISAAARKAS